MGPLTTHTGTFSIDDRIASAWHYLPVEVPPGTAALRVTLSYPRESGALLDLGCLSPDGFRGWSGGARDSFLVSEPGATPGYLAGPVPAGPWQVVTGLHLVPESGVPFTVSAEAISASGETASSVLSGLRAGRVAISASRDGAVLLRHRDSLVAVGADGLVLAGPTAPYKRILGDLARLPGVPGYHRLLTPANATVALTP